MLVPGWIKEFTVRRNLWICLDLRWHPGKQAESLKEKRINR